MFILIGKILTCLFEKIGFKSQHLGLKKKKKKETKKKKEKLKIFFFF